MIELRPVKREELPQIPAIGVAFFKEASLPGEMRHDVFVRNWEIYFDLNIGVMLGLFDGGKCTGVLGGLILPDPNDGELVASELFWYVLKEHRIGGIRLLKAFEEHAKVRGAKRITMVHLLQENAEKLGRYYQKNGYSPIECHYIKQLAS